MLSWMLMASVSLAAPLVMGHRGSAGVRPEHTRSSYVVAAESGADYIEPDLVMTKDGVLIARHENDISETTDVAVKFPSRKKTKTIDGVSITGYFTEDFTLKEIKTLRAKERLAFRDHSRDFTDEVMTFEEVIALAKELSSKLKREVRLVPELKHPTYFKSISLDPVPAFVRAMKAHGLESSAIIQCFELGTLRDLKKSLKANLLFLFDDLKARPADFVASGDKRTYGDLLGDLKSVASVVSWIGPAKEQLVTADGKSTGVIERAHAVGLKVVPYTFRSEAQFVVPAAHGDAKAEYALFFSLGVDAVFTDFVDEAVKARGALK